MSEIQQILTLSRRALARAEELCLATVVHVEGSSYRKPGARMLLTSGGERAGTISGGCLEAEVSRKAWWLTASGPSIERYSSFAEEDGSLPYGLGCGGTVTLLLERGPAVAATLGALEQGLTHQQPSVLITALLQMDQDHAGEPGVLAILAPVTDDHGDSRGASPTLLPVYLRATLPSDLSLNRMHALAAQALDEQRSFYSAQGSQHSSSSRAQEASGLPAYFVEYLAPPPALTIFGAGDDAQPIAALAHALGWRVTVADGRAHLARRDRFPQAAAVRVLDWEQVLGRENPGLRAACGLDGGGAAEPGPSELVEALDTVSSAGSVIESDPLAVILTHSYAQDRALLAALLPRKLAYLGILGPRHRTERLLGEIAPVLGLTLDDAMNRLHSPVGLDLGASDPASVALSILAEIQAVLHHRRFAMVRAPQAASDAGPPPQADFQPQPAPLMSLAEAVRG